MIRSDGTPERDFLYVEDAAAAYLAIADALGAGGPAARRSTPAASSRTRSREVVELIAAIAGTDVEPDIRGTGNPARRDRPPVRRLDEAARADRLGAREVGLEDGLRRTLEWYRDHPEARPSAQE